MSLSARGGDTTPSGNAAPRGRLDPATSMPRPEAHAGACQKAGHLPGHSAGDKGRTNCLGHLPQSVLWGLAPANPAAGCAGHCSAT